MARPHERVIAIVAAVLFLTTTVGFSGIVVWQMYQDNKTSNSSAKTDTKKGENTLQGTRLNGFTPMARVESLQKIDEKVGTGNEAKAGDTVTAHYTGAVAATGIIFQSSYDTGQPVPFSLNGVIKGWSEGVPGMKVGGKRRLLIPADQAYGANPPAGSGMPANADLVFAIDLVKIGQQRKKHNIWWVDMGRDAIYNT